MERKKTRLGSGNYGTVFQRDEKTAEKIQLVDLGHTLPRHILIESDILNNCYHPHIVNLTSEELQEYIEISKKLARCFNQESGTLDNNDIASKLLLKRKRIIHKAVNKLAITRHILQQRFD